VNKTETSHLGLFRSSVVISIFLSPRSNSPPPSNKSLMDFLTFVWLVFSKLVSKLHLQREMSIQTRISLRT